MFRIFASFVLMFTLLCLPIPALAQCYEATFSGWASSRGFGHTCETIVQNAETRVEELVEEQKAACQDISYRSYPDNESLEFTYVPANSCSTNGNNLESRIEFVFNCLCAAPGDSNFDGVFDSKDFVSVFEGGRFEQGAPATWEQGDWNGDNEFNSRDLVTAFQSGTYTP